MGKVKDLYSRVREEAVRKMACYLAWCFYPRKDGNDASYDETEIRNEHLGYNRSKGDSRNNGCIQNNDKVLQLTSTVKPKNFDADELQRQFSNIIDDLDVNDSQRRCLLELPSEKKWQIYVSSLHFLGCSNPQYYIDEIRDSFGSFSNSLILESLSTCLRTERTTFVEGFLKLGGLKLLSDCVDVVKRLHSNKALKWEKENFTSGLIRCIRSLMNSTIGRAHVLNDDLFIDDMASLLKDRSDHNAKTNIYEILGALCLVPNGHRKVLSAISNLQKLTGHRSRFQMMLLDLESTETSLRLTRSIISFINAVISYDEGEENLEFRLHLRYEFLTLDYDHILERLDQIDNADLNKHIKFFYLMKKRDESEFFERTCPMTPKSLSLASLYPALEANINHSVAQTYVSSILYHMLMISNQSDESLWVVLDQITKEIAVKQCTDISQLLLQILKVAKDSMKSTQELSNLQELIKSKDSLLRKQDVQLQQLNGEVNRLKSLREKKLIDHPPDGIRMARPPRKHEAAMLASLDSKATDRSLTPNANAGTVSNSNLKAQPCISIEENFKSTTSVESCNENFTGNSTVCSMNSDSDEKSNSSSVPPPPPPPPPPISFGFQEDTIINVCPPPPPPLPSIDHNGSNTNNSYTISKIPPASKPLKPLNWTKLPENKLHDTVWEKLEPERFYEQLNLEELDRCFGVESFDKKTNITNVAPQSQTQYNIIESRRAQNLTILLSKLKASDEDIIQCVVECQKSDILPLDMVEQLAKFVPTAEEVRKLSQIASVEELPRADTFLYKVSRIPQWASLLFILDYKKRFVEQRAELNRKIELVMKGSEEILNSKGVGELLSVILAVGNYMNNKGRKGYATAFSLQTLLRIQDTKSNNVPSTKSQRFNLLHFLAEEIQTKWPHLLKLQEDLTHSSQAKKISLLELEKDVQSLEQGLKRVKNELNAQEDNQTNQKLLKSTKEFVQSTDFELELLSQNLKNMKIQFQKVTAKFGEKFENPEEFFNIFDYFLTSLSDAVSENTRRKHKTNPIQASPMKPSSSLNGLSKRTKLTNIDCKEIEAENEFDELIIALSSGDVFNENKGCKKRSAFIAQKQKQTNKHYGNRERNN